MKVAPLGAVLVGPRAPGLRNVVLGIKGGVVVAETLVLCLTRGRAGDNLGGVDVVDEVEHFRGEVCSFFRVAAGSDEGFDGGCLSGGCGRVDGRGGDVIAVLVERWVVDGGIPVAALPASDSVAENIGEVIVISRLRSAAARKGHGLCKSIKARTKTKEANGRNPRPLLHKMKNCWTKLPDVARIKSARKIIREGRYQEIFLT